MLIRKESRKNQFDMAKRYLKNKNQTLFIILPLVKDIQEIDNKHEKSVSGYFFNDSGEIALVENINKNNIRKFLDKSNKVIVVIKSPDVNIINVKCPRLSPKDLALAMPTLVEDHLLTPPEKLLLIPGEWLNGMQSIFVMDKIILRFISSLFSGLNSHRINIIPSQLTIAPPTDTTYFALIEDFKNFKNLSIRLNENKFISVSFPKLMSLDENKNIINLINSMCGEKKVIIAINDNLKSELDKEIYSDEKQQFISTVKYSIKKHSILEDQSFVDISHLVAQKKSYRFSLSKWKYPVLSLIALVLFNGIALQWQVNRLENQRESIRNNIKDIFYKNFSRDIPMLDPLSQLSQKAADQENITSFGQNSLLNLLTGLGELREAISESGGADNINHQITSIEFRDNDLYVFYQKNEEYFLKNYQSVASELGLSISESYSKDKGLVWKISGSQ